jgi:hypothetical protein
MEAMVKLTGDLNLSNKISVKESSQYYNEKINIKEVNPQSNNKELREGENKSIIKQDFKEYSQTLNTQVEKILNTQDLRIIDFNDAIQNLKNIENNNGDVKEPSMYENFNKFFELQKNEIQKTKESIEKVFLAIKEGYTKTEKGTFISKETGEEKTQQELIEMVKTSVQEKVQTTREEFIQGIKNFKDIQVGENKDITVENILRITQSIFEPLQNITPFVDAINMMSSSINDGKNNNVINNTDENTLVDNSMKSVTTYVNEKVQPLFSQVIPEITKILSQSNDSIVTSISSIDSTNKEAILNNRELNNTLTDNTTKILQNENNTVTGKLVGQQQSPTPIQAQTPTYQPLENNVVEKYFKNVEKTTIEQKNGKVEQNVKFDSPLLMKIEVTGMPQNNREATNAFLRWIETDRRFGIAMEKAIVNRNFNLVEKLD